MKFAIVTAALAIAAPGIAQAQSAPDDAPSFTLKAYVQLDAGEVGNPDGAIAADDLDWDVRDRRIVIGGEGKLGGGFGYKAEFNLAGGELGYEDIYLSWQPKGSPLIFTVGHSYPLSGLDTMTSSRLVSVVERGAGNNAFDFARRVGATAALVDPEDRWSLTAGIYQAPLDAAFEDDRWQWAARGVWSPDVAGGRLHLGVNVQHREAPSDAQSVRARARPFTQLTDTRFVDSGALPARGDDVLGLELAGIFGPVHFAGEAHRLWVNGVEGGGDPDFTASYAEAGVFLTGETRGYKGGKWDKTKVLRPVGEGGWGAFQLNARIEHADLDDAGVDGGRQTGYLANLVWLPVERLRLVAQYGRVQVEGGPRAATVDPIDRRFETDMFVLRFQIEY